MAEQIANTPYPNREAARRALTGAAGGAANRFFRDATAKSTDFSITASAEGYQLTFFSPARTPGYGKRYHQHVDHDGRIVREYKETWGSEGIIETKWIHGGDDDDEDGSSFAR